MELHEPSWSLGDLKPRSGEATNYTACDLAYGQERESLRLLLPFIALAEHLRDVRQEMAKERVTWRHRCGGRL